VGALGDRFRDCFGNALDVDLRACAARAFGDCLGHLLDMAIRGVVENENFAHREAPIELFDVANVDGS
jgi:hypothetical protein